MSPAEFITETTPSGIEIRYLPNSHQYRLEIDGKWTRVPGATGLTSQLSKGDALIYWSHNLRDEGLDWREERDRRAAEGSAAHDSVLRFLRDDELPTDATGYNKAYLNWWLEHEPEPIQHEVMVASAKHQFGGRFDLLCKIGDETVRGDFKTSASPKLDKRGNLLPPYPEHLLQLELYELAAVESGYPASDKRAVIRLFESGEYDMTYSWAAAPDVLPLIELRHMQDRLKARHKALAAA